MIGVSNSRCFSYEHSKTFQFILQPDTVRGFFGRKYWDHDNGPTTPVEVGLEPVNFADEWINITLQERLLIIDQITTKLFEHENNQHDEGSNEDIDDYVSMFAISLPCITKPTALNLTIFLFVNIDLISFIGNLPLANSHDINTS